MSAEVSEEIAIRSRPGLLFARICILPTILCIQQLVVLVLWALC